MTTAPEAVRVRTDPDPYEQYLISQAIRVGDLVYLSGQAAVDSHGNIVGAGDFDAQAAQVFANLKAVLEAAGSSMDRIVKVTIYLTDMANFGRIMELRAQHFSKPYPADTIVEVKALALPEFKIEIEAIGLVGGTIRDT
ncbi:RidA family protein [Marinibaculum pumilum]|uniref:RidA family protein n=1 Tax=Marinibaculum pumilum TaxID=1766165 RepID=A0ABV7KW05_9PROT